MARHGGFQLRGVPGILTAGVCFIGSAVTLTAAVARLYVTYGQFPLVEPLLYAIKPALLAVIFGAPWRLGRTVVKNGDLALTGAVVAGPVLPESGEHSVWKWIRTCGLPGTRSGPGVRLVEARAAAGCDCLRLVHAGAGPFHVQLHGLRGLGAVVAMPGMVAPSFVIVMMLHPIVPRPRQSKWTAPFMHAVNVRAVGLTGTVTARLALTSRRRWQGWVIAPVAALAGLYGTLHAAWRVLTGALLGWMLIQAGNPVKQPHSERSLKRKLVDSRARVGAQVSHPIMNSVPIDVERYASKSPHGPDWNPG